jgi:hypothetical protein
MAAVVQTSLLEPEPIAPPVEPQQTPPPQDDGRNERAHEALADFIAGRR